MLIVIDLRLLQTEIIINKTNNIMQELIIAVSVTTVLLSLVGNILITIQMIKALKYINKQNNKYDRTRITRT